MQKNDFAYDDEYCFYYTEIFGARIEIAEKNINDETIGFAEKIALMYPEKLDEIAGYLSQDEGMRIFFGNLSKEQIIAGLHMPTLHVADNTGGSLAYCNHIFDDVHIIDLEFIGFFEKFLYISIDG